MLHIHCAVAAMDHEVSGQAGFPSCKVPAFIKGSLSVRADLEYGPDTAEFRTSKGNHARTSRLRRQSNRCRALPESHKPSCT